ncbi:hypothetical protein BLA60_05455 [Actinophytocola xinjiangensis]|uniref:Uncharacterized protein n=1 Tax=Actinophytocola xinjiangensis TaxID=485602 RepID=A0A7Z1B0W2_9PSEU|nr:hypothetical protein [Actinophytocola xinjiangensis]OLF12725.1 hypothetical protein BLA60_05455 [Actinophytocola xinjiangensis]
MTWNEVDALLQEAGKRGFMWHQYRVDRHGPDVLAGVFQWEGFADVVVILDDTHAHAYRTPTGPDTDVFAPTRVTWWYGDNTRLWQSRPGLLPVTGINGDSLVWTLRALLTLPEPGHPQAPVTVVPALPGTGISGARVPVRIRRRTVTRPPQETRQFGATS